MPTPFGFEAKRARIRQIEKDLEEGWYIPTIASKHGVTPNRVHQIKRALAKRKKDQEESDGRMGKP